MFSDFSEGPPLENGINGQSEDYQYFHIPRKESLLLFIGYSLRLLTKRLQLKKLFFS